MGEWVIGAFVNLFGSIAINFGTNLLKLAHNERGTLSAVDHLGINGKKQLKPIIYFQSWRIGILFFLLGNCLNFVSFGYAAQSLLAALGSVQFISNIAFAYFVFKKLVSVRILVATAFIVVGNVLLVAFGNHQSPVYTPEQLVEKYSNRTFLLYCVILILIIVTHHVAYRRAEVLLISPGQERRQYWQILLPFSFAVVSGAIGSCSVLFAKSLSILLRLATSDGYQLHNWFTFSMLLLFLSTAGFWMARLNEGLSLFDAILIVPMFQIVWTFFSICTGIIYFQEYQVFDALRTTMFVLGVVSVFLGISLLAPGESKGGDTKELPLASVPSSSITSETDRLMFPSDDGQHKEERTAGLSLMVGITNMVAKAKIASAMSLGLGEDVINASVVFVMPMASSKITGFRGTGLYQSKIFSLKNSGLSKMYFDDDDDGVRMHDEAPLLPISVR